MLIKFPLYLFEGDVFSQQSLLEVSDTSATVKFFLSDKNPKHNNSLDYTFSPWNRVPGLRYAFFLNGTCLYIHPHPHTHTLFVEIQINRLKVAKDHFFGIHSRISSHSGGIRLCTKNQILGGARA